MPRVVKFFQKSFFFKQFYDLQELNLIKESIPRRTLKISLESFDRNHSKRVFNDDSVVKGIERPMFWQFSISKTFLSNDSRKT